MAKRKGYLRHHTRRDGKKQPTAQGTALLLPRGEVCAQCGGNTVSRRSSLDLPSYLVPAPISSPAQHPRGFALVHSLIVEITLIILLVLGCCTLVMPKIKMVLEEWHKLQSSSNSHASLGPTMNNDASSPSVPNAGPAVQTHITAQNETTSNGSRRKEGKRQSIKRQRKRANFCKHHLPPTAMNIKTRSTM